jgi:hypothetical protein
VLKSAVRTAKPGREEELSAFTRLDDQARRIECLLSGSRVEALIAEEKRLSHSYAGRSVFGREPPPKDRAGVDSAAAAQARSPRFMRDRCGFAGALAACERLPQAPQRRRQSASSPARAQSVDDDVDRHALSVIGIDKSCPDDGIAANDESRGNWQNPSIVALIGRDIPTSTLPELLHLLANENRQIKRKRVAIVDVVVRIGNGFTAGSAFRTVVKCCKSGVIETIWPPIGSTSHCACASAFVLIRQ